MPLRRFSEAFTLDANKAPRTWRPHENIPALAKQARLEAAFLLAQLAVIRPPGGAPAPPPDVVELAVMRLARKDVEEAGAAAEAGAPRSAGTSRADPG